MHIYEIRLSKAMIRVYDEAGNVIETHEHAGDNRSKPTAGRYNERI